MIIEKLQRKLQRTATVYGALAAFAYAGMGHFATAQTAKSAEGAVAAPATIDATLAAYQQVPLSQVSAESMGAKAKAAKAKPVAAEEEETTAPSKPGSEGIKVHGHWVLQVKNQDGTLGERREFENSLVAGTGYAATSGDQLLTASLTGLITPGGLAVALIQGPASTPGIDLTTFCNYGTALGEVARPAGIDCFLFVPGSSRWQAGGNSVTNFVEPTFQTGLSQAVNLSPAASVVLSGNFVVPANLSEIDAVQSYEAYCSLPSKNQFQLLGSGVAPLVADSSPSACATGNGLPGTDLISFGALTSTSVPVALTGLTKGQVIQVTFTLSFS